MKLGLHIAMDFIAKVSSLGLGGCHFEEYRV
jgi:hypothetical protein